LNEEYVVSTPEQVAFSYEMAGIGSRALAAFLDYLIMTASLILVYCALIMMSSVAGAAQLLDVDSSFGAFFIGALLVLVVFGIWWGYFILFEMIWRGSTPGKRVMRIRVLRADGQPVGVGEAIIRNLVRLIDFLPGFYSIGLITMFLNQEARRLGDYAANTVVVKERDRVALRDVRVSGYVPQGAGGVQYDPLPGISLYSVTPDDYRLMRELLERINRGELTVARGRELGTRLAYGIAARMGHDFGQWQRRGWDPLVFVQSVLAARAVRGE
jgi:uncharacterized RDD family membrane protein YckC